MTTIPYTYEVTAVNDRSMDVTYTNSEHGSTQVSVRLPFDGETLEDVIAQFSPALWWDTMSRPVQAVPVGAAGAGATVTAPEVIERTPKEQLAYERSMMVASRLQGRLTLGEAVCVKLDAIAADPATPWAMRQTILNAIEWRRTSQAMTELAYLLEFTPEKMDELFRLAMQVEV